MNSDTTKPHFGKVPEEYSREFLERTLRELTQVLQQMTSPGVVRAQKLAISELPTAAAGLRTGDIWSDSGTLKVV